MSLSDIMSNADLSVYPEIAMVIFLGVFLIVGIRILRSDPKEMREIAKSALDDDGSMSSESHDVERSASS